VDWRQCAAVMRREAVTYAKFLWLDDVAVA